MEKKLSDSRNLVDPLPLERFSVEKEIKAQFVKFELVSWYGHGGGLQFFDIERKGKSKYQKRSTLITIRLLVDEYPQAEHVLQEFIGELKRVSVGPYFVWGVNKEDKLVKLDKKSWKPLETKGD